MLLLVMVLLDVGGALRKRYVWLVLAVTIEGNKGTSISSLCQHNNLAVHAPLVQHQARHPPAQSKPHAPITCAYRWW